MSLEAVRVKEEPACLATEDVTIKEEPELVEAGWVQNEAEYVPPLCVQQVHQLEPACTKHEVVGELEPVYTELETVCFKDEPISAQQPVCVKLEPPWQGSVWSELDQEFKYEIPVVSGPLPADTRNVKGSKWDCFVRLERCDVPRGAALRARAAAGRPGARHATPTPNVSRAHEREIAMKQLSGMLIKRIDKIDNSYSCEICKKQYKNLACLTTHKVGHTKKTRSKVTRSDRNTYFCEICKAVFHDLDRLKVHALIHAKMTIPLYLCDICHREFATNHALRTHKRAHKLFKCTFCKERFKQPNDLARHLAKHSSHKQWAKLANFCKGCETKQALRQLGGLLRSRLGQTSETTDFCELCNNRPH